MDIQKHELNEKRLIRWLLIAVLVLAILVLGLHAWRLAFPGAPIQDDGGSLLQDGPEAPQTADTAPGVSPGKTAMIEDIRSLNASLSFDDLAALSTEELEQLYQTGAPGLPIGISAAASAAEEYAGTLEMDSITWDAGPELDENPAHYEVELHHITLGDFDYKVDAYTGEVLEGRANLFSTVPAASDPESAVNYSAAQAPAAQTPVSQAQNSAAQAVAPTTQTPAPTSQTPAPAAQAQTSAPQASAAQNNSGLIGEDAAKAAAFTHAGVAEADVSGLRIKLDWEDHIQVYEIEFTSGGTEYDYEIDASTGAVRKAEQERNNTSRAQSNSSQTGSFIGEEAAKTAALTHAGVAEASAGRIQCKLDRDDGRWIYEIEFRSGSTEYEYEIDASTGAVLKAEQDH